MSLNSQVMATMESEGILKDEGLEGPLGATDVSTRVDTSNPMITSQTPVTDELKSKILAPNTVYKSLVDNVEKISTMEEVAENIATQNAISFADAEEVAMTFENFGSKVSLKEFSKTPSKINLAFTQRFMMESINHEKQELKSVCEEYFDGHIVSAEDAFEDYQGFYGKNLVETLGNYQITTYEWITNKKSIPLQLIEYQGEYINLATVNLEEFPKHFNGLGNYGVFKDAVENLQKLAKDNIHVKNLLKTICLNGNVEDFLSADKTAEAIEDQVALVDFIKMFANPYLKQFVISFENLAEESVKKLRELNSESEINPSDFTQVRDFLVKHGDDIDEYQANVHYYIEVVEILQKLYINTTAIVDYFTVA